MKLLGCRSAWLYGWFGKIEMVASSSDGESGSGNGSG